MIDKVNGYLASLDHHLGLFDVDQFFAKLKNALVQRKLLDELCGGDDEIHKKLEKWDMMQNTALHEAITEQFRNLDIELFFKQPPSLVLKKLANHPNECEFLKTLIIEKYKNELEVRLFIQTILFGHYFMILNFPGRH